MATVRKTPKADPTCARILAATPERKEQFFRDGKKLLRQVAKLLDLDPAAYRISDCRGGPAVLGEVILHHDAFYVMLVGKYGFTPVLYRTCNGRKDYCGGTNRWVRAEDCTSARAIARVINRGLGLGLDLDS